MKIKAKLKEIKNCEGLNLLSFDYYGNTIKVLMLEMNIDLKKNDEAFLKVKPTLLSLSDIKPQCENVLKVQILSIKKGEIMANVICRYKNDIFEVLMLKEYTGFEKEAYMFFKSNFVVVEK